jgi:hypothetical protein
MLEDEIQELLWSAVAIDPEAIPHLVMDEAVPASVHAVVQLLIARLNAQEAAIMRLAREIETGG